MLKLGCTRAEAEAAARARRRLRARARSRSQREPGPLVRAAGGAPRAHAAALAAVLWRRSCGRGGGRRSCSGSSGPAEVMKPILDRYEKEHPGVHVRMEQLTWQSGLEKITAAIASGNVPDLCELGSTWMPRMLNAGALTDWSAGVADLKAPPAAAGRLCSIGDATYGLPWVMGTRALFYNKTLSRARRARLDAPAADLGRAVRRRRRDPEARPGHPRVRRPGRRAVRPVQEVHAVRLGQRRPHPLRRSLPRRVRLAAEPRSARVLPQAPLRRHARPAGRARPRVQARAGSGSRSRARGCSSRSRATLPRSATASRWCRGRISSAARTPRSRAARCS